MLNRSSEINETFFKVILKLCVPSDAVLSNLYAFLLFRFSDLVDQSCFTSTVTSLSAGDQVFLQLQDLHRRVNANEGKTFWGLLRLN